MSRVQDLRSRIVRKARAKITRIRYRLGRPTLEPGPAHIAADFRHIIDAHDKAGLVARYSSLFPQAAQRELAEARRLLQHDFHFLGHSMRHGEKIAWSRDPLSGRDWSQGFSADIPYRGPQRLGDIKLPWELNKHQYFFTLGKAAWLSGDEAYAREIIAQISAWIAENPCHCGIHWISALEAGTRALSWILSWPFFAEFTEPAFRERMTRSIAQHLLFVERNLSVGRYANTHLAGEAAILVVGALFIDCRHSSRWLALGLHHLEEQMTQQVHGDGVHAEQSVAYHRFFLDQYYLVHALLQANGRSLAPSIRQRMEQMTDFLMDVLHPDGSAPAFGDCDDARGIWCHADCPKEYRSLLALGALLSARGDFKRVAARPAEEVLWLHGIEGMDRYESLPERQPKHLSKAYPDAGYYILRGGWGPQDPMLVFDCGPLGHGPAGHGHADALSFQLYAQEYPFLTDPGTYAYNIDYRWRDIFRATLAHNTLTVDGVSQSLPKDRMSWERTANASCKRWISTPEFDLIDAVHDGYLQLADPVLHRRIVIFIKPDVWLCYDQLTATKAEHELQLALHLRPDCSIEPGAAGVTVLNSPSGCPLYVHGAVERLDNNEHGVFSAGYGQKTPAPMLVATRRFQNTTTLLTVFSTRPDTGFEIHAQNAALQVSPVAGRGRTLTLSYSLAEPAELRVNGRPFA